MSARIPPLVRSWLALLICAAAATAQAAPAKRWSITDLGAAGGWGSRATALNNRGDVVGETGTPPPDGIHPFLWRNGQLLDLGTPAPATFGFVRGVTDRGAVLVNTERGGAYLWKDGAWNDLQVGSAMAVNKFESIAGNFTPPGSGFSRAYLLARGVFHDLGTLGGPGSRATSLNDRGAVAGASNPPGTFDEHAFVYEDGAMKDLGTLGGRSSIAYDINNRGVAVGAAGLADGRTAAFMHDGATMRLLPSPPAFFSEAVAINDRGDIVGRACCTPAASGWLLEDGVLTRLDDIAEVRAAGWTSVVPADINDRGWIVGQAQNAAGQWHAFLLTPR